MNKIIEVDINGNETVLLDVSGVTATANKVADGVTFVNNRGALLTGNALVGEDVMMESKIKDVLDYRYRIIPTYAEYKQRYNGGTEPIAYGAIYPITNSDGKVVADSIWEMKAVNPANIAVYDNKLKGWVLGTLNTELTQSVARAVGISTNRVALYQLVGNLVAKKFSHFVMPSKFQTTYMTWNTNSVYAVASPTTSNGVTVDKQTRKWDKIYDDTTLTERYYLALTRVVDTVYPKFLYEFSKYLSVENQMGTLKDSVQGLITSLAQLRTANHIDGTTLMHSANTPEVIIDATPEEVLDKYMSSIFKTQNNKEDNYTAVMEHFEELVDEMVNQVAYQVFTVNWG